jgi:hypothetical protein
VETLDQVLEYVNVVAFVALAVLTFRQWHRRRDTGSRWAALTFASLATVVSVGQIVPDDAEGTVADWVDRLVIVVLLLFPYFLFRLATSFSEKRLAFVDRAALLLTLSLCVWGAVMPEFPEPGEERSDIFRLFVLVVLLQWVLLSGWVAVRFWRAGAGQPDVARKRMRMLSAAATAMSLAIVIAGTASDQDVVVDTIVQVIALAAVLSFFVAFSPPAWLVAVWRRETQAAARRATLSVLSSSSAEEVVAQVLPHAVATVGGRSIAMFDKDGKLLGSSGFDDEELAELDRRIEAVPERYVRLDYPFGCLVVGTSRHMHFFGEDDINLLGAIGTVANLGIQRLSSLEVEKKLTEATLRRRQALEINDNIVQQLVVAHYSFELGRTEEGIRASENALKAAQKTVSDLVGELSAEDPLGHTSLTRQEPASGPRRDRDASL